MLRDGAIATWSEVVNSLGDVHENARLVISQSFHSFPYCVWSPTFAGNYGRSRSTYLCIGEGKIGFIRAEGKTIHHISIPISEIDEFETGTELLSSWITIYFHGQRASVFFNSVSKPLYARFKDAFLAERETESDFNPIQEDNETYLKALKKEDFKYETYVRRVLGKRRPLASFYHPTASAPRSIFGARIISSYLLIAAGGLLYSFSEGRIIRYVRSVNYSMVIRYIPIATTLMLRHTDMKDTYSIQSFSRFEWPLLEVPVSTTKSGEFSTFCRESKIAWSDQRGVTQ